jgi:hypothetical protein
LRIERRVVGTDAILAVRNQPDSDKPLVEGERGILKDSPDLDGELFPSVLALAFPHPASREESHIIPAKVGHSTPAGQRRATTNFRNALLSQVYYCPCALSCNLMHFFALTKLTALFMGFRTPRQKIGGAGRDTSRLLLIRLFQVATSPGCACPGEAQDVVVC